MLTIDSINKIVESAKAVYWAYLCLEFANKPLQPTEGSLATQINKAILEKQKNPTITLGGKKYALKLTPKGSSERKIPADQPTDLYEVTLKEEKTCELDSRVTKPKIVSLKEYTLAEKQTLLTTHSFTACLDKVSNTYLLGTSLEVNGKGLEIGGPDKISLYASHIANLGIFIKTLELNKSKKQVPAMLAALATGSGKSFTQALWILILHLADVKGIFAAPAGLIKQLEKDVRRLIPDSVASIIELPEAKEDRDSEQKSATSDKSFKIVSYDTLFSPEFTASIAKSFEPASTLLSFDEQHVVSAREDWSVKLRDLVKKYSTLFLTATPTRNTFQLSGQSTAVSMSRKQKENAGYAVPAENIQRVAPSFKGKIAVSEEGWFTRRMYHLLSSFANALVAEVTTPVDEMVRHAKYRFVAKQRERKEQTLEHFLRWNIAIPAADKMLIVTHDHDTLINLCRGLEDKDVTQSIYHDGTLVQRTNIYDLFQIDNIEDTISKEYDEKSCDRFRSQLKDHVRKSGYSVESNILLEAYLNDVTKNISMKTYAKRIIFTGVVNQALRVLTGYDLITLDKLRHEDLNKLSDEVRTKAKAWEGTIESLTEQFEAEGLDSITAKKLAENVYRVLLYLKGEEDTNSVIDNWVMKADQNCAEIFGSAFNWESHYTRFTFHGLEKNHEEKVKDGVVYSAFRETSKPLRTEKGSFDPMSKKRQHNAIEIFNDRTQEYSYSPVVSEEKMTIDQLKTAFKMGLIPFMVSNSMVEGFNDPDLHVTVNLVSQTHDSSNQPAKIIQAAGRNRGLNKHRIPIYMQIHNTGVETLFSLQSLDKDDYVPDFLSSTVRYNQKILDSQGKKLANGIKQWIQENLKADGSLDETQLKNYIFSLAKDSILALNVGNDHNLEKSRQQFVTVLDSLQNELNLVQYKIRNTYELSFFVSIIGNILNWVAKLAYRPYKNTAYAALCAHVRDKHTDDSIDSRKSRLYQKIVGRDLSLMQKQGMVFSMLGDLLTSQAAKIKAEIDFDETSLIDQKLAIKSVKINVCQALNSAKIAKQPQDEKFNKKCDALVNALISQPDTDFTTDEQLTSDVVQNKLLESLSKNQRAKEIFRDLTEEEKLIISQSVMKKINDNSIKSDIRASLKINQCQGYELLKDLIHNPIFLEMLTDIVEDYTDDELELFLPSEMGDDKLSERALKLKSFAADLRAMHRGRESMTPDDFDNKYFKFIRTMETTRCLLEDAKTIFMTQFNCHLYFHQINKKGVPEVQEPPTLIQGLNLGDGALRVQTSSMGKLAAKATQVFFLKAIKESLPAFNSLNFTVQRKQASYLSTVSEDIITPLRAALHNGWRWRYFGTISNKIQHDSAEFADVLKDAKPLDTEAAQTRQHCFSGLTK